MKWKFSMKPLPFPWSISKCIWFTCIVATSKLYQMSLAKSILYYGFTNCLWFGYCWDMFFFYWSFPTPFTTVIAWIIHFTYRITTIPSWCFLPYGKTGTGFNINVVLCEHIFPTYVDKEIKEKFRLLTDFYSCNIWLLCKLIAILSLPVQQKKRHQQHHQ